MALSSCFFLYSLQDGWTALHLAAQLGLIDVVRALVKADAHIDQRSNVM